MATRLHSGAWDDVYASRRVVPGSPAAPPEQSAELAAAIAEAQAQADALRTLVDQAETMMQVCRELIDALRAILTYPTAYGWPGTGTSSAAGDPPTCEVS